MRKPLPNHLNRADTVVHHKEATKAVAMEEEAAAAADTIKDHRDRAPDRKGMVSSHQVVMADRLQASRGTLHNRATGLHHPRGTEPRSRKGLSERQKSILLGRRITGAKSRRLLSIFSFVLHMHM